MLKKTIVIDFPDDFTPPDRFIEPTALNGWQSPCEDCGCPFYQWDDEYALGTCKFPPSCHGFPECDDYPDDCTGCPKLGACPLKEYF